MAGGGFLGTRASLTADLILVGSLLVAVLLTIGVVLAVRGRYDTHRWVQTTAASVNALLVLLMIGSLITVDPSHNVGLPPIAFTLMPAHEGVGAVAVLFGLFVTLRANGLMPRRLQFSNYKRFMRVAYALYLAATLVGLGVYAALYT
jgi:uncharacterized membrane protein YozB (DUF420 family)